MRTESWSVWGHLWCQSILDTISEGCVTSRHPTLPELRWWRLILTTKMLWMKKHLTMINCHRQRCKKKIATGKGARRRLENSNNWTKSKKISRSNAENCQRTIYDTRSFRQEGTETGTWTLSSKNEKLSCNSLDKTVLSTTWYQLFYYMKYIRILIYLIRFYLCQIIYTS